MAGFSDRSPLVDRRDFLKAVLAVGSFTFVACGGSSQSVESTPNSSRSPASSTSSIECHDAQEVKFSTTPDFEQDFSKLPDGPLDRHVWGFDIGTGTNGWGNGEAQYYTDRPQNARIENGRLIIEARQEKYRGAGITSARLTTRAHFKPEYGKLEVRARLPKGVGTWSAIWLLPSDRKYGSDSPEAQKESLGWLKDGEIDIVEHVGADEGQIVASAHAYEFNPTNHNVRQGIVTVPDTASTFHTYGLEWSPGKLVYTVDGKPFYDVPNPCTGPNAWPYDQHYYLVLNLAMGGAWGGYKKNAFPPDGIDRSSGPWRFEIASIKHFALEQ